MADQVWLITYKIRKVDGTPFEVPKEMHRLVEEQIPRAIKEAAEKIAERFDFPFVEVTAKRTQDGRTHRFTHQADEGLRQDWVAGRQ